MMVSKRSGFFRRQNLMMIRFIYLFIYLFLLFFLILLFFVPVRTQRMQFTVFILKIDHLPIASAAKSKTSTGKNFILL